MAGIYIPDMQMPTRCFACPMCDTDCCGISKGPYIEYRDVDIDVAMNGRPDWCPLVAVPDHGRLIDADDAILALRPSSSFMESDACGTWEMIWNEECDTINRLPTIIPGERKDESNV